jgi:L-fuculose-phosphate aldolase
MHEESAISVQDGLCRYGRRLMVAGMSCGTGGNISAREGDIIWMKPSGFAMDELTPDLLCGVDMVTGAQRVGPHPPTTEVNMHLAVYRARPDIHAVFHTHPPWLTGVISAGVPFRPLTTECRGYLGRILHMPYILPQSQLLADRVGEAARTHETLLLPNHGALTLGRDMREAFHRSLVAEDTAKSLVAAAAVGTPLYLTEEQIAELEANEAGMEGGT